MQTLNKKGAFVIIGNGIAGTTCAEELAKRVSGQRIVLIGQEPYPLYNRVALPRFLKGQVREEKVFLRTVEQHEQQGIELYLNTVVTHIDFTERKVVCQDGKEFQFSKLLIATGGRPMPPPWPGETQELLQFQTLDDTKQIIAIAEPGKTAAVIGNGLIAYELAEGLRHRGLHVHWIIRGPRVLSNMLDDEGASLCQLLGEEAGVEFHIGENPASIAKKNGKLQITTKPDRSYTVDMACYGIGLKFYLEFLENSPININRGIVVNERLQTNVDNVYAAGDIAEYFDLMLGRHNIMGTWDNAEAHGKVAAANMAGEPTAYNDVPTYTTTMFHSTLAVMGEISNTNPDLKSYSRLNLEEKSYRKLYFKDNILVGVVMIGPPKGRKKLLELMQTKRPFDGKPEDLLDPAYLATL
jgi:NAD(P)H-nitrite reductase large subunit